MSEIDFITGCKNEKSKLAWNHNECGNKEKINDQGIIRCIKCGNLGEFFLLKYEFSRHNCSKYGNYNTFEAALSVLATFNINFAAKLAY